MQLTNVLRDVGEDASQGRLQARLGYPALSPSGRLTALAGERLYATILTRIEENDFDVFNTRAHVSTGRKLGALPGIAASFMRLSWPGALDQRPA
jgi:phytoene/squalene synthetase